MAKKQKAIDINKYDTHTQLYLRVYDDQERRHRRFRYLYGIMAVLAAFVPPLSLFFTVQATWMDWKNRKLKSGFHRLEAIGACLLFALVPLAFGLIGHNLISEFENNRRRKDKIQKVTYAESDLLHEKAYFTQVKTQMHDLLGISLKENFSQPDQSLGIKKEKVKIYYDKEEPEFTSKMVDVYMDAAQIERRQKRGECGSLLHLMKGKVKTEEEVSTKLSGVSEFFKTKHAESIKIVEALETQYKLK